MKRKIKFALMIVLLTAAVSCKKDKSTTIKDEITVKNEIVTKQNERLSKVVSTATINTFLQGTVLDESGQPISGAKVSVSGKTQTTDSKGYFVFDEITLNKDFAVVKAEKSGYLKSIRTFAPIAEFENTVELRLQSKGEVQSISASQGGEVVFNDGDLKLNFPADAISDAKGTKYSGEVIISARFLNSDSENFNLLIPGISKGLTSDDELSDINSYGIVNVELKDGQGNPLQITIGKTVGVSILNSAGITGNTLSWHFNETYGLWVESGIVSVNSNYLTFEANHFSAWNIGDIIVRVHENVLIVDSEGNPIANTIINLYSPDMRYINSVVTNQYGWIYLPPAPSFVLRLATPCQVIDKLLVMKAGDLMVAFPIKNYEMGEYQFSGTLRSCSGVLPNAKFQLIGITDSKINITGKTNENGEFNLSKVLCDLNTDINHQLQLMVVTDEVTYREELNITFNKSVISLNQNLCSSTVFQTTYLNTGVVYGSVKDVEGYTYPTVKIGNQTWMAENLRVSKTNNGKVIENLTLNADWRKTTEAAWSFYDNNGNYHKLFGKLYNWQAVGNGGLCPKGWHIPNQEDWQKLIQTLSETKGGGSMKAKEVWYAPNLGATNSSGFTALPGGERGDFGGYKNVGHRINFWSSTEMGNEYAVNAYLTSGSTYVSEYFAQKMHGAYCRCIKD